VRSRMVGPSPGIVVVVGPPMVRVVVEVVDVVDAVVVVVVVVVMLVVVVGGAVVVLQATQAGPGRYVPGSVSAPGPGRSSAALTSPWGVRGMQKTDASRPVAATPAVRGPKA